MALYTSSLGPQPPSTSEPSAPEIVPLQPEASGPDVASHQPDPSGANVVSHQPDPSGPDVISPYPQPNTDALRKFISALNCMYYTAKANQLSNLTVWLLQFQDL